MNDENSQDGEQVRNLGRAFDVIFDGDYIYYIENERWGTTNPHDELSVVNLRTGESKDHYMGSNEMGDLVLKSSNEDEAVLSFKTIDAMYGIFKHSYEITVDKKNLSFDKKKELHREKEPVIQKEGLSLEAFSFLKQGMAMEEVYKTVGEPTENDAKWRIYELNNSNKLYLKENADSLEEIWIKGADGTMVKVQCNEWKQNILIDKTI